MNAFSLGVQIMKERLTAGRMMVIWPLFAIIILFSTWGLTDENASVSTGYDIESAYDVMFLATAFVIWSCTLGAVLVSFDGISRDRTSGVLEVKLSQPMERKKLSFSILFGHWGAIFLPFFVLQCISLVIMWFRIDEFPTLGNLFLFFLSSALLLMWWTVIQLLASSWANDIGLSISLGLGAWITFTLLWLIPTTLIAGLTGVGVEDLNSSEYVELAAIVDLFSPNGVYGHLLEMPLDDVDRGMSPLYISIAAILWSIIPVYLFTRRIERLHP